MYRIVIADDEEDVRELLAKNINQSQSEYQVVGKAEDGQEAVEMVKNLKPDILITDICMPLVGGLDLIRKIQALERPVKTVIISGYDDFSYAKQALTLGVTDYLLKPFMPDEMYEVLDKIKEQLERQKTMLHNMKEMQARLDGNIPVLQERFLVNLVQSREDLSSREETARGIEKEAEQVKINLQANQYAVGILRIQQNLIGQKKDIKDFLSAVKDTYFDRKCRTYLAQINEKQLVILFQGGCRSRQSFLKTVKEGMTAIGKSMEKYYNLSFHCILGRVCSQWTQIPVSYKDALSVWKGFLESTDIVICYEEALHHKRDRGNESFERPRKLEQDLVMHIQMGKNEKAQDDLYEILQYYESMDIQLSEFVSVSLVELVFDISSTLMKAGGQVYLWKDENVVEYLKKHFAYGSLWDAREVLEEYVTKCCEQFSRVNEKQGDRIVFQVKQLIEKNLGDEEFNLETASARLYFSPNYVRQIFRQITGESFQEYLIRRRMETAKELLKNPVYKIQDVALKTGYSSQRYFSSCFKKYFGCTPTEYRVAIYEEI